jgi:DNA-binding transcriptional MerR regulator
MTADPEEQAERDDGGITGSVKRILPGPPPKLYTTGELMAHTNLSRQTLHNYKRIGLIQPVKWTAGGHCYYGEEVFDRIKRIKLYQRHRSLTQIRELFAAEEGGEAGGDGDGSNSTAGGPEPGSRRVPAAKESADAVDVESLPPPVDLAGSDRKVADRRDAEGPERARLLLKGRPEAGYPPRLYQIGDLIRLTGFSRQTLHNYTVQRLLRERFRTDSGKRLYDESAFSILRLIEVLKRHRRFDEVQALLDVWREDRRLPQDLGVVATPDPNGGPAGRRPTDGDPGTAQ